NQDRKRDLIADMLKEEFEDNKKVHSARLTGFAQRRFQIRLDQEKLVQYHIGANEVLAKIRTRNVNIPGGSLKGDESQQLVRLEGKVQNVEELRNMVIRSNFSGQKVLLKDIALVEDSEEDIKVISRHNGKEATLLIASKKGGADTIALVKEINKKLEKFKSKYTDYEFHIYNNESSKVENRLNVLTSNAVSGLVLVVVFLFIFLPGRIGLVASLSLPLAILGTVGMMPSFGMNLNAITILALVIALGMLVDNSVVISENFTRLREEGDPPLVAAKKSVLSLWLPITATAFTTIAAFLPMLVTRGIMGQFIKFIPVVVTISLIVSLFESFFFLPMRLVLAGGEVKPVKAGEHSDWFSKFQRKFEKLMAWTIKRRYLMSGAFIALFATSIFLMGVANKFILFPPDQTEIYVSRIEMPIGTKVSETSSALKQLSASVEEVLGKNVKHIVARAGTSKMQPNDPKAKDGNNVGMLIIYVTDEAKDNLSHIEGLRLLRSIETSSYIREASFEAMINGPPVGNDIEATFRSNSFDELDGIISKVISELGKVDGISDLKANDVFGDDEIFININYSLADRLGLNIQSIGETLKATIAGSIVSTVTLDNKDVDLMVRFKENYRQDLESLKKVEVMDNQGNLVPLGTIASFDKRRGAPQIKRFDFKRSKTVTGNVDDTKIT
ncbi:efflux RND transporter permease subunit, partial [Bacteriovoracaceae bacterium]|nr:efflux RND transporter permease subunit [Bacteriovoracaceae bacterium]